MTKADEKRLDPFLHKCLRRILKVHWPMGVSNDEIRRRSGDRKDQYTRTRQAMEVDRSCSAYGTKPKPTCGINLGTKREKETRTAKGNMAENSGKGTR